MDDSFAGDFCVKIPGRDPAFREPWMTGNVQTMLSMSVCDEIYLY
jgi:hypothetical protein